ncbi:hypothetical protein F4809DRAFT_609482 [Biscogniauxia mediterranea]|nr:hypothetical protein F4809DRAFT_609482 [Biscogniauxia mediterranea]
MYVKQEKKKKKNQIIMIVDLSPTPLPFLFPHILLLCGHLIYWAFFFLSFFPGSSYIYACRALHIYVYVYAYALSLFAAVGVLVPVREREN